MAYTNPYAWKWISPLAVKRNVSPVPTNLEFLSWVQDPLAWVKKAIWPISSSVKKKYQDQKDAKAVLDKQIPFAQKTTNDIITTQSLADFVATTDAKPEITKKEIREKFPEFAGKEQSLADFLATIEAKPNMTQEEIMQKFPEIYDPSNRPESNITTFLKQMSIPSEKLMKWSKSFLWWVVEWWLDVAKKVEANTLGRVIPWYNESLAKESPTFTPSQWYETAYNVGKEVYPIVASAVATAPIGWAWGAWTLWKIVAWATEWVAGNTVYNAMKWNDISQNAWLAWTVWWAVPLVGVWLKTLPKMFWKTAESYAVKWLLNTNDAKAIVNTLRETGEWDVWSLWRRALENNIAWKNTDNALSELKKIKTTAYNDVRKVVSDVSNKMWPLWVDDSVQKAMTVVWKNVDAVNARMWFEAVPKWEIESILQSAKDGTITLVQKQRAKELLDEFVNIYKKSWDVADTQIAWEADKLRQSLRSSIEDSVTVWTNWATNLKELNRQVAVASRFSEWITKKSIANELKQYAIQGSLWSVAWAGWEFKPDSPQRRWRVIIWWLVWRQLWSALWNPVIMWNIAKYVDKLSLWTRTNLLQYAKYPTKVKLTENSLNELLSIKQAVESNDEVTTAIKLLKEWPLESNPLRLTTPAKTRTLWPWATQQTKRPLLLDTKNATNMSNNGNSTI